MTTRDFNALTAKTERDTGDEIVVQPVGDVQPQRMSLALLALVADLTAAIQTHAGLANAHHTPPTLPDNVVDWTKQ